MPRVLIIGVGSIGERHLRCFQQTGRADVSLVEVNPALRQSVADRYGITTAWANLDDALVHPPDIAVVATPAPFHVAMTQQLVERGVHVLIEKPLSIREDGLDSLAAAIDQNGVTVGVAYVMRHHPLLQRMRSAIHSGRFGKHVQIVVVSGQHFPLYRPAYRDIYYKDHATGGGAIQDALTHLMNAGEWLVGPVTKLVADADHKVLDGVTVEDTVHVITRHADVMGSFSLNQHQAPNETTITVICENGTARLEWHAHRWRWMTEPGSEWQDETISPLERDTLFIAQANAFLDAIEQHQPVACSLAEGRQTLRVNLAALQSVTTGQWSELSPST